jgi:LacI family transcriptional regulator
VTLADVAAHAGVDASVVSRVLSRDPRLNIRDATRDRVLRSVQVLDYRPNELARGLRTSRAKAFGLLIPDFANPVYSSIIAGAEAAATELGYLLVTASLAGQTAVLGEGRVDGLLLAGPEHGLRPDVPVILVNRRTAGARRYVILDDERAARLAVEHLAHLGHRRIAHVAGPEDADTAQRRLTGYLRAMTDAGLAVDDDLVVHADYTDTGGATAMRALVTRGRPPTAVFVANVASAIGALHEARTAGLRLPGDLSVVAVHDLPLAGYLSPPLTTVRMPLGELGRQAITLLASVPPDEHVQVVVEGPMELVVRGSTAPPR